MSYQPNQQRRELERRLKLVERRVDRLLDPEIGIYAALRNLEQRLRGWAIALLTSVLIGVVLELVQLLSHHG